MILLTIIHKQYDTYIRSSVIIATIFTFVHIGMPYIINYVIYILHTMFSIM